jgi:hypothetical protein
MEAAVIARLLLCTPYYNLAKLGLAHRLAHPQSYSMTFKRMFMKITRTLLCYERERKPCLEIVRTVASSPFLDTR